MQFFSKSTTVLDRVTFAGSLLMLVTINNAASGQTNRPSASAQPTTGSSKQPSATKGSRKGAKKSSIPAGRRILSLDEMLKIALKHNPDIREADAKRQLAEAELHRTRLEVVKSLSAYRTESQFATTALRLAELNLLQAKNVNSRAPGAVSQIQIQRLKLDVEKARASLLKMETRLPYLLGRAPGRAAKRRVQKTTQTEALRSKAVAEQIVTLKLKAYKAGQRRGVTEIVEWANRLADIDLALAKSKADRIASVDEHRSRLLRLMKMVEALYQARQTAKDDVLVVEFHLLQAERLMKRTKSATSSSN